MAAQLGEDHSPLDRPIPNQALAFLASKSCAGPPQISHTITHPFVQMSRYFFDIPSMASSSVSQEDFDNDFELTSRRSRIRNARARVGLPRTGDASSINFQRNRPNAEELQGVCDASSNNVLPPEHENQQTKPIMRKQDKRVTGRSTHINKGKQQRDRRKLREKRRSTGVVHLPSTEVCHCFQSH